MSLQKLLSVLILMAASVNLAIGQEEEKLDKSNFVCSYTAGVINEKSICSMLGFRTRPEAQKAVERIVSRSGLKQNFYVMECPNIDNCFAAARNGERLIVYDASFMRRVNNITNTDWGAMSILAHEIGHHLQGHTLKQGGSDPNRELEADEFSGFVMYQMGASLKEAQSAIWKMTTDYDSGSHPPRRKRMTAIKRGYENAKALYPRLSSEPINEIEREKPKTEPVLRKPEVVKKPTVKPRNVVTVKTGCIKGNCSQGYGVAVNRKTLEKYEGNWKNGRRSGYGIEYYADNRKKYEGDFSGSSFHGYGTYYFKNGSKYVGKFKQGLMHDDKATFYYPNGDRLYIRYVNGKKQGKGRVVYYGGVQGTIFFENDIEK